MDDMVVRTLSLAAGMVIGFVVFWLLLWAVAMVRHHRATKLTDGRRGRGLR